MFTKEDYLYLCHCRLPLGDFVAHMTLVTIYDMKNIFCLFERPFKIQKNGVFLFEISFFVSEILSFLYYAN